MYENNPGQVGSFVSVILSYKYNLSEPLSRATKPTGIPEIKGSILEHTFFFNLKLEGIKA